MKIKINILILFIFLKFSNAFAKEEIWSCQMHPKLSPVFYKINTKEPSVAVRRDGKWIYYKGISYDKKNQNLSSTTPGSESMFDLITREYDGFKCKVKSN